MKKWEEILLNKELPNPIPPTPYVNLDEKFGFVDREEELKVILDYVKKATIENKGKLIFLLADQGRGKTAFLNYLVKKYSYPDTKYIFSYMSFPMKIEELDFTLIFQKYLHSLYHSGAIIDIYDKFFNENEKILGKKPENFDEIKKVAQKIKFKINELNINYPKIVTTILYSLPPSPYYLDVFNFLEGDSLDLPDENLNFLSVNKNEQAITRMKFLSKFTKDYIGIEHTILIIDDFDILDRNEEIFRSLYKLLIFFRNNSSIIQDFTLILSGSVTFYDEFLNSLTQNERNRIESWIYTINLDFLKPKDFLDIINKCFKYYWNSYLENSPFPENIYGIFSNEAIEFLYQYNDNDLRLTLKRLYDLIEKIRNEQKIEYYTDINRVIKEFKKEKIGLKELELDYFRENLIKKAKDEKSSTFINKNLTKFISSLKDYFKDQKIYIEVECEKKIDSQFADIYLKVNKFNTSQSFAVIFEIKMTDNIIKFKEIESRLEMLKEVNNSYLFWISKSELEKIKIPNDLNKRILRDKPLNKTEISYLSYLVNIFDLFPIDELSYQDRVLLLRQAGIDINRILNPPVIGEAIKKEERDIDTLIEEILNDFKNEQSRVMKRKVLKLVKEKDEFKDFSEDYILSRIIEISEKLNYKVKPDYIIFKTKDFE